MNKKNYSVKYYFILIIIGLINACTHDEPELVKPNYESVVLNCLYQKDAEFIITTEQEYIQMATQIYREMSGNCADTTQAPFDFNYYVLLGRYAEFDSNDKLTKEVIEDNNLKKIIYKIEKTIVNNPSNNGGFGNILTVGMNWIIIPKPPEDYKIIIDYQEN